MDDHRGPPPAGVLEVVRDPVLERVLLAAAFGGHGKDVGRLVDDDDLSVFVNDRKTRIGPGSLLQRVALLGIVADHNLVARLDWRARFAAGLTVEGDAVVIEQPANLVVGKSGEGEHHPRGHGGLFVGNTRRLGNQGHPLVIGGARRGSK